MGRPKNPNVWTKRDCLQCQKEFDVRIKEVKIGKGKFCSLSCSTTYRNIHNNPTKCPVVRKKISENHADVSGKNNPMYGKRGKLAPSYIDGRNSFVGEIYRKIALANLEHECSICKDDDLSKLEVHHIDGDRENNDITNLIFLCRKCHSTVAHTYLRDELGRFVGSRLNDISLYLEENYERRDICGHQ